MLEINGRHLCESCFCEMKDGAFCTNCGYTPNATVGDSTMLRPGSVLLRKYVIGKTIGKGGFGITYVAYDVTTQKKVAIKEFFPYGIAIRIPGTTTVTVSSMDDAEAYKIGAEKFCNEAQTVSRFNGNPNIVGVHEFFCENNTVYFVMEYLQGHTLKEHIKIHGVLPCAQALFIMNRVSDALKVAHSANVLHRDISPDNIILCDNGNVKLIDFGAARQVVAEHSQSFSVILKPGFAPLEQYQRKGNQGPWTDIYSLGATIYHALTGDILADPMSRIDDDEEFSENIYDIEPELWAVIRKATQLKMEDRYGDVVMLKNDLARISYQPQPVTVPTADTSNKMPQPQPQPQTVAPYGMAQTSVRTVTSPQYSAVSAPLNTAANIPAQPQSPVRSQTHGQAQAPVQQTTQNSNKAKIGIILAVLAIALIVIVVLISSGGNSGGGYTGGSSGIGHNTAANNYVPSGSNSSSQSTAPVVPQTAMYDVGLKVKCEENLVANRYDIDILVDGRNLSTLPHGKSETYGLTLTEGSHTIEFRLASKGITGKPLYDPEDEGSYQKVTLNISDNMTASYIVKIAVGNTVKVTRE